MIEIVVIFCLLGLFFGFFGFFVIWALTGLIGVRITALIDGGNVAGDRVLCSKFLKIGPEGPDREVRFGLVFPGLRACA